MKAYLRLLSGALAALTLLSFAACSKNEAATSGNVVTVETLPTQGDRLEGRYLETDITPNNMQGTPTSITRRTDGTLDLLCQSYDDATGIVAYARYKSTDNGATWQQLDMDWAGDYTMGNDALSNTDALVSLGREMVVLDDGSLLTTVENMDTETYAYQRRFLRVNEAGQEMEALLQTGGGEEAHVARLLSLPGGRVLVLFIQGSDANENGLGGVYNTATGEQLYSLYSWNEIDAFCNENALYLETEDSLVAYDLATGKDLGAVVESYPYTRVSWFPNGGAGNFVDESGSLYVVSRYGAFGVGDSGLGKTLMEGVNYSYGAPFATVVDVAYTADNIVVAIGTEDGGAVYRYDNDSSLSFEADKHLTVYSFLDSETIRYALVQFAKQNPDVTLQYTHSLSTTGGPDPYGDGLSIAMAGQALQAALGEGGADVVVLDGLPYEELDSSQLKDLSDLVDDSLYTNLLQPLYNGDALYTLPTRFTTPVLVGDNGKVQNYTDLQDLLQGITSGAATPGYAAEDAQFGTEPDVSPDDLPDLPPTAGGNDTTATQDYDNTSQPLLYMYDTEEITYSLYDVAVPVLATEQGAEAYLDAVQSIRQHYGLTASSGGQLTFAERRTLSSSAYSYAYGSSQLGVTQLASFDALYTLRQEQLRGGLTTATPEAGVVAMPVFEEGVYTPTVLVGVPAVSGNQDLAEDFLTALLQPEYVYDSYEGLPVGKQALAQGAQRYTERTAANQNGAPAVEIDIDAIAASVTVPVMANDAQMQNITAIAVAYCEEIIDRQAAVEAILREME